MKGEVNDLGSIDQSIEFKTLPYSSLPAPICDGMPQSELVFTIDGLFQLFEKLFCFVSCFRCSRAAAGIAVSV